LKQKLNAAAQTINAGDCDFQRFKLLSRKAQ
jgi:hypothetical protein